MAIIGAGIAGVSTAYFTLEKTDKTVLLIERARLAHGATGHNAGLVVAGFERPLPDMEREFGFERAAEALRAAERGWELIERLHRDAAPNVPFARFTEATGLLDAGHVARFAREADFRRRAGAAFAPIKVARGAVDPAALAEVDPSLVLWVEREEIDRALESGAGRHVGLLEEPGGVINSALLCQEVVRHLLAKFPGRFRLIEETKVQKIVVKEDAALLDVGEFTVSAGEAVLCTNGFEDFTILSGGGLALDREFHRNVRGIVGYMSGYLTPKDRPPAGLVYLESEGFSEDDAYHYVSRRPYEYERGAGPRHNLVSAGGPQELLEDHNAYSLDDEYPAARAEEIQRFVEATYGEGAPREDQRIFSWHGLMGYTPGMVRLVGPNPAAPRLLYNLGCNGIGILMSLWGGETIARHLSGEAVPRTIFTPGGDAR